MVFGDTVANTLSSKTPQPIIRELFIKYLLEVEK